MEKVAKGKAKKKDMAKLSKALKENMKRRKISRRKKEGEN